MAQEVNTGPISKGGTVPPRLWERPVRVPTQIVVVFEVPIQVR